MDQVVKAMEAGTCSLAVSGALLRDPEVMLALADRAAMNPMALSGPAVAPVEPVGETGAARSLASKGGVLVLVEPERVDQQGIEKLGAMLKRSPNKPTVVVVARQYNPFTFGSALMGLNVQHHKDRGKSFVKGLPMPPDDLATPEVPKAVKAKKGTSNAPKFVFAGRDEEVEALTAMLGEGGPVVVSGPMGVGRGQVAEHAIEAAGLERLPELVLTWDTGFDSLLGRLAVLCAENGAGGLKAEIENKEHTPKSLVAAAIAALSEADLGGKAMIVHDLEFALGPDTDFFRRSRQELLVEALLTHAYSLRLIFTSTRQPVFHREGQAAPLRRLELGGIKGRFLHEIFEGYKAPEFAREKFGPISERTHGHPYAAKLFAVSLRDHDNPLKLVDDEKYFKLKGLDDQKGLSRRIDKAIGRLSKPLRAHLALLAHTRLSLTGKQLSAMKVSRKDRLALLSAGVLDVVGTNDAKRYRVHELVRKQLSWREVHDFTVAEELAGYFKDFAEKASDKVEALAWKQEANRLFVAARRGRSRVGMPVPDFDATLESVIGLIRGKKPRFDMARQRIKEVLNRQPANSDAWLLLAELERRDDATKADAEIAAFEEAAAKAPVPEIYHRSAGFWLGRRKRPKAIEVLEQGVKTLDDEPRLHTRLASLLLRQGRRPEGLEHLNKAMELAPMLPDAYGLMGQARRAEGEIDEAETLLREAARLGADDPVQVARLVDLLMARARIDQDRQDELREQARELLDTIITGDRKAPDAYLLLATLIRETTGDLERCAWLLKKARKGTERGTGRHRRIQIEAALQAMASGKLDQAENDLRGRTTRDPSDHRAFAALGHVLEAREMFVPAHAEYLRAKERAPKNSLAAQLYELHLKRMQSVIEAQAAGLLNPPPTPAEGEVPQGPSGHQRVIRRKGNRDEDSGTDVEADASAAPAEAASEAKAEAPVEAPTEEKADAPKTEADDVSDHSAPETAAEAGAAAVASPEAVEQANSMVEAMMSGSDEPNPDGHQRVIRRKKDAVESAPEAAQAAAEATPEASEGGADVAPEAADESASNSE